ncbi:hypothetical protein SLA2020_274140 [Shorea laevis]
MTDRVYPSSKPTTNGTATATAVTNNGVAPAAAAKPQLRQPYRPQPHHRRLGPLRAVPAAAAAVLGLLPPHCEAEPHHIRRLLLLPPELPLQPHAFLQEPQLPHHLLLRPLYPRLLSSSGSVQIANGSIPAFTSNKKNETNFRAILAASTDLDTESVTSLRSDLKRKNGVPMKIQMDTKVKVKLGGLTSNKVGIRVTCQGITGIAPKSKSPSVASVSGSKCKVDLRIKIWKFTF